MCGTALSDQVCSLWQWCPVVSIAWLVLEHSHLHLYELRGTVMHLVADSRATGHIWGKENWSTPLHRLAE